MKNLVIAFREEEWPFWDHLPREAKEALALGLKEMSLTFWGLDPEDPSVYSERPWECTAQTNESSSTGSPSSSLKSSEPRPGDEEKSLPHSVSGSSLTSLLKAFNNGSETFPAEEIELPGDNAHQDATDLPGADKEGAD